MSSANSQLIDDLGYAVVPLLSPSEVERQMLSLAELGLNEDQSLFVSAVGSERDVGRAIDQRLRSELGPAVSRVVSGFVPFVATYLIKGANGGEMMHFHQDWTYVDERQHRSRAVWIPLVDVDERNGAMRLIPGSHLWSTNIRPSNTGEMAPTDAHLDAFDRMAVTIPMSAGEVLIYDPAIVHGTPRNVTGQIRLVIGMALAPAGTTPAHFRLDDAGVIRGVKVPSDAFYIDAYSNAREFEALEPWTRRLEARDFDRFVTPTSPPPVVASSDSPQSRLFDFVRRMRRPHPG